MKKIRFSTILLVIVILTGFSLLLYPAVSDYITSLNFRKAIADYQSKVKTLNSETYNEVLSAAKEYNIKLSQKSMTLASLTDEEKKVYESMLDITGTGIMGYIEIPSINISLPIYHGTNDAVLQSGIGHIEGSSLPIGGESTHSILSGHRGLPSSKMFTNIDRLNKGDTFNLRVLNETLSYEIDQIQTVKPNELDVLKFEKGKDYCTLMTCTPYGVNTHRLLVRGHRIETPEQQETIQDILRKFDLRLIIPIVIIVIFTIIFLLLALRRRKNRQ